MPVTFTTEAPQEEQPTLGNGVEDEIAIEWPDYSNYGDYRVQVRESGQESWSESATGWDELVVDESTSSVISTGREDGEEYEARLRMETEHGTGDWTQPVSIVTKFPGATQAAVTSSSTTSVTVDAQDNADNEDGFELEREERIEGEWRDQRVVADVGPHSGEGAISITDDTPSPGTEYRYRVRPYTEHTSATSNWTDAVTTQGLDGVTTERTGSSGWQVQVEHANGSIHRPRTIGSPSFQPTINGLPKARVPVPVDEKWQAKGFENANVEAWVDGRRLPVDELVDVEDQSDRMILVLEGGTTLRDRVQREVDEQDAHTVAESIITDTVEYAATVDDPAANTRGDVLMADADTDVEFQQELADAPFADDDPRVIANGRLTTHQCAHVIEAEEMDTGTADLRDLNQDIYSSGEAMLLNGNFTLSGTVTTEYDYPDGDALVGVRINYFDNTVPGFEIRVDEEVVLSYDTGDNPITGILPPHWVDIEIGFRSRSGFRKISESRAYPSAIRPGPAFRLIMISDLGDQDGIILDLIDNPVL